MVYIISMGHSHPTHEIDNQFLENLDIGTNAEWISEKIGIQTRKTSLPVEYIRETRNEDPRQAVAVASHTATDLGEQAAKMALERANLSASDIGMLLCNCCTPAELFPVESERLMSRLGVKGTVYDVQTACPAFALHIDYVSNFKESELPDYVLCISTATLTQSVNYNERSDGAIWGDGAAAWIISPRKLGRLRTLDSYFAADPTRCESVVIDTFGHFHQDGRAIRDFSVRQTVRLIKRMEKEFDIDWNRDVFIGHQANATMLEQITRNRKIPDDNHWRNVTHIGNQAGASAPAVLSMNWDKLEQGQKVAIAVVGAGLSWGSALFEVLEEAP